MGKVRWKILAACVVAVAWKAAPAQQQAQSSVASVNGDGSAQTLAEEVRDKGRLLFCARSDAGDWDLFVCRPDGSDLHNVTRTPQYNEAAPQFSRDGRRLLYRRLPRNEEIDGNLYGAQGRLVVANSDGTSPKVFGAGGQYPWASWSPDGGQLACLSIEGISIVDIASRRSIRTLARKGFFSS